MNTLNLPAFDHKIRKGDNARDEIWDGFRRKYVALTPEEWVRQHFLHFLVAERHFPAALMGVEVALKINHMPKRCDIVAYDRSGKPLMIVECKAPHVEITQDVFNQVALYNLSVIGPYVVVTNGFTHYACKINHAEKNWQFLPDIPDYKLIQR